MDSETLGAPPLLVWGDSGAMRQLGDGSVDFILTGPPYFSLETEALLKQPRRSQRDPDGVARDLAVFASRLRPSFREMYRALKPGRAAVIQTKDIRYAGVLLPVATLHRQDLEAAGFRLHDRIFWWRRWDRLRRGAAFLSSRDVTRFQVDDVEEFLVFFKGVPGRAVNPRPSVAERMARKLDCPLWDVRPRTHGRHHRFEMPEEIARRLIKIYSGPGELVLDPFAGSATTLVVATRLGRRAAGYEVDRACWDMAAARIKEQVDGSR